MANLTTTQANVAVKELIDPLIHASYDFNMRTLKLIKKQASTEGVTSLGRYFTVQVGSNESYGSASSEGGAFPATGRYEDVRCLVNYRSQFSSFGFTGDVLDLAGNHELMNNFKRTVKDTTESFDEKQNLFLFGTGNGVLGVIDSISTNDITMLNTVANGYGARNIRKNQILNAYDQSGAAYRSGDMTVTSVARSTDIVTVDAAAGSIASDDDDVLVFKGSYGYATNGFAYNVADSGTFFGQSRTTYPSLKSTVHDAASSSIDWDMLELAVLKATNVQGDSAMMDDYTLICHPVQIKNLKAAARAAAGATFNTSMGGTKVADLGIQDVAYNGMKFHADSSCSPSDIWGLRLGDWAIEEAAPRQLYKHNDGSILIQQLAASTSYGDAKEGRVYWRYNLACKTPYRQFRIKNVNFATGDTRIQRA